MSDQTEGRGIAARLRLLSEGLGATVLAALAGASAGYWARDFEVRWLHGMVPALLALALLAAAARLLAVRRVRSRAVPIALVAAAALIVAIAARAPTPLTAMDAGEFLAAHTLDGTQYRDLERTLAELRERLAGVASLRAAGASVLATDEEPVVLDAWTAYLDTALALDQVRRYYEDYWRFDLTTLERDRHVRSFLLTFAAELALWQHTGAVIELLDGNPSAVRFLEEARPARGFPAGTVTRVREEMSGFTDLARVSAGRRYLAFLARAYHADQAAVAGSYEWLWQEVARQLAAVLVRGSRAGTALAMSSDVAPLRRDLRHLTFPVQREVAEWMGDRRVRRVGRYLIEPGLCAQAQSRLAPGDVLLARKNWYLSNLGLPGFWPHALLYVGGDAELAAAFDGDPAVREWLRAETGREVAFVDYLAERFPAAWEERTIAAASGEPRVIVEAVSEGVVQSALIHVAGDYLAAVRPRLPPLAKAQAIAAALGYLGRPYDFDFDFATDDALVCTELVWRAYRPHGDVPGLVLPPVPIAGRLTLPANEIAAAFRDGSASGAPQLDFVLYIEGRERPPGAAFRDESAFADTVARSRWDFAQP